MPLNTPGDLITFVLKSAGVTGVGQSALAEDYNDAFDVLNGMLAQWNRQRWMIWHLIDTSALSNGQLSYTIGPGGDFNVPRPDRIEAAFVRLITASPSDPVDYPIHIMSSREDYNRIPLKSMRTNVPSALFYDSAFPIGTVYVWPIASAGSVEIHLSIKDTLTQFTSFIQPIQLPMEYFQAIWTNLTVLLAPIYQYEPNPVVVAQAQASLATIRGANTQIPKLHMPRGLAGRRGGSGYPVFGGGGGGNETLDDLDALLATLPTTLPGTPGILWNDNGVLALS